MPEKILVNGKDIRGRFAQMTIWSVTAAAIGAAFVAGLYFLLLQVRWYVHIGPVNFQIFSLKHWWDHLFHYKSWFLYRHGLRDLLEPAAATMGVKTLLAKAKWWNTRVGPIRLTTAPVILLTLASGLAVGGIWLLDFGFPQLWRHLFGTYVVTAPAWISHSSWQIIGLGIGIGLVLHRFWAPVGATIQGYAVDHEVGKALLRASSATGAVRVGYSPFWVRYPVMAPVIRERFSWTVASELSRYGTLAAWKKAEAPKKATATHKVLYLLFALGILLFLLIVAAGFLGHYYVGTGHSVPYLAP